jgi:hypothetical protein
VFICLEKEGLIMTEPLYEVVWPLGRSTIGVKPLAPRVKSLSGITIGGLWNQLFKGDVLLSEIVRLLQKRFPGIELVDHASFGDIHGRHEAAVVADLPEKLRKYGCGAVISAVGG